MHHHRIDGGLLQQNDVAGEGFREVFGAHGMAAIFDDDGFLVIPLHVRQRLGQDAGLIEWTDIWRVGHEAGLVVSGWGGFYLIGGHGAKCCSLLSLPLYEITGRSPDTAQRAALAAWCAADPGSIEQ